MITLQSLGKDEGGHGTFAVNVDGVDTGARVVNGARGWEVRRGGFGVFDPGGGWHRISQVVAALESDAGRKWLRGTS